MTSAYLELKPRSLDEYRADKLRRQIAIETNRQWRQLLDLNAEYIRKAEWKRTPEGQAYLAIGEEFRAEQREREEAKLIDDLIVRNAP